MTDAPQVAGRTLWHVLDEMTSLVMDVERGAETIGRKDIAWIHRVMWASQ